VYENQIEKHWESQRKYDDVVSEREPK
jgi:hypothetical protein